MLLPNLHETLKAMFIGNPAVNKVVVRTTCKHDGRLSARVFLSRKSLAETVGHRMGSNAHRKNTYALMEGSVGLPDTIPGNVRRNFQTALDDVVREAAGRPDVVNNILGRESVYTWFLQPQEDGVEPEAERELVHNALCEVELRAPQPAPEGDEFMDMDFDDPPRNIHDRVNNGIVDARNNRELPDHDEFISRRLNGNR